MQGVGQLLEQDYHFLLLTKLSTYMTPGNMEVHQVHYMVHPHQDGWNVPI